MVAAITGFPARSRRRPHGRPAASRRYERRRPEKTPLHEIVSENLESCLEWREAAERPVPAISVPKRLRGSLACSTPRPPPTCSPGRTAGFQETPASGSHSSTATCRAMFQSLEHLLRYCVRPPFALERLSVIRGEDGRINRIRYLLPRHKAANWVGPGRGRKSTPPGPNGVVELPPFEFLDRLADLVPPPRKGVPGVSRNPLRTPGPLLPRRTSRSSAGRSLQRCH